jgi:exosome complex component RRP43
MTSSQQNEISTFQRLHPRAYLERFLAEGIRPDAREPNTFRNLDVNVGKSEQHFGS